MILKNNNSKWYIFKFFLYIKMIIFFIELFRANSLNSQTKLWAWMESITYFFCIYFLNVR